MTQLHRFAAVLALALGSASCAARPGATPAAPSPAPATSSAATPRGPRPYAQVVPARALTDSGGIPSHRVDDRWLLEIPDSLTDRDMLLVSRIAAVPANFGAYLPAGVSVAERLVRWERQGNRVLLRAIGADAVAADSLPIALSVASNNLGAILGAFPVQAFGADSAAVIDATDFLAGDTPALSGLSAAQRKQFEVRRLDPARSFVSAVRSFPLNVEIRHVQTYDAASPPSDRTGGTLTLEMRQSLVVLPREPMRPRFADPRAGYFTVARVNYGLDVQKAETERFITRWRLEPKDPAAYARGELVEPVQPIVYYLDPATPERWRPYVRRGVEDWGRVFEKAGFRNAVRAMDPPSPAEEPEWDPEDIRYSVVRWSASTTRNAQGPSTVDPRSGEIIESDIVWYHNHMRSYRNRLLIETGAANPAARTLDIPQELMGETMRQVITHEVGHAIGLPHNMIASASFPVDSLRSAGFARRYGVSATIMDYARQNYVAQPGDGLVGSDFIRRVGPFDDFIIEWGYRVFPDAPTPESERPRLDRMLSSPPGPFPYRYLPQEMTGIDPRSQTEDLGDDPVAASRYAVANLRRVVPNLPAWTARGGETDDELAELYRETVGMWSLYMRHVASVIGGVYVDPRTATQPGAVYTPLPRDRQRRALDFLAEQAIRTPEWLAPLAITSRVGPSPLESAQATVLQALLDPRRLDRLSMSGELTGTAAYPLADYLADLRRVVWSDRAPDANRRALQRVYLDRLAALVDPPASGATLPAAGRSALLGPVNLTRGDLPALSRSELRAIQALARSAASTAATPLHRAHWADVAARIDRALEAEN